MGRSKRPPKEDLVALVPHMSDAKIAEAYGVVRSTVYQWRRYYDLQSDGSYWPQNQCQNPQCAEFVSQCLINGLCMACDEFLKRVGRHRTKADMKDKLGATGFCKRCKENAAVWNRMCEACDKYLRDNGKPRPKYLYRKKMCKQCGRPYKSGTMRRGRCEACRSYLRRHGVERPERLWANTAWCDCGQPAVHLGVVVEVFTGEGNTKPLTYDFCEDCWQLEQEDTPTKGEAVWNR